MARKWEDLRGAMSVSTGMEDVSEGQSDQSRECLRGTGHQAWTGWVFQVSRIRDCVLLEQRLL